MIIFELHEGVKELEKNSTFFGSCCLKLTRWERENKPFIPLQMHHLFFLSLALLRYHRVLGYLKDYITWLTDCWQIKQQFISWQLMQYLKVSKDVRKWSGTSTSISSSTATSIPTECSIFCYLYISVKEPYFLVYFSFLPFFFFYEFKRF